MFKNAFVSKVMLAASFFSLTCLSAAAHAAPASENFVAKLVSVKTVSNGQLALNFDKNICNKSKATNAPGDDDSFAAVPATAAGRDQILSVSLAALLADKSVSVWITDPVQEGESCTIVSVQIRK